MTTKPTPRHICDVINRMLAIVPDSETELRADLNRVSQRALFAAPEVMRTHWRRVQGILIDALGADPKGWQEAVRLEFTGKAK